MDNNKKIIKGLIPKFEIFFFGGKDPKLTFRKLNNHQQVHPKWYLKHII